MLFEVFKQDVVCLQTLADELCILCTPQNHIALGVAHSNLPMHL